METLLGLLFILGCVGIWYFARKKTEQTKQKHFNSYSCAFSIDNGIFANRTNSNKF